MNKIYITYSQHWEGWVHLTDSEFELLNDGKAFFNDYSNGVVLIHSDEDNDDTYGDELKSFRWTDEEESDYEPVYDYDTPNGVDWTLIEEKE